MLDVRSIFSLSDRMFATQTSANLLIIALVIVVGVVLLAVGRYATRPLTRLVVSSAAASQLNAVGAPPAIVAFFQCAEGKFIRAVYSGENVALDLSDGRELSIPREHGAASGERYANPNETFVFVEQAGKAFISEDTLKTYANCLKN